MAASATFALKPVSGSGGVVCSLSLLIRGAQRARRQAETPLIVLFSFLRPALFNPSFLQIKAPLKRARSYERARVHNHTDAHIGNYRRAYIRKHKVARSG